MRAAPTPGAGAMVESESSTTGSTSSQKFVAFGGATQPPRSSERARPRVSLRQTQQAKPFPALTAASAGSSGANSAPFSRELRRVIRGRREAPVAGPRARQSERPDDLESPVIPRLVMMATITDGLRSARGRRERVALHHAPTKAREDARALSWPVRVAARAGNSSEQIGVDRSKSESCLQFDRH